MSNNVAEYIVGWLFDGLQDDEKITDLFENVFSGPPTRHTHGHTHMLARDF